LWWWSDPDPQNVTVFLAQKGSLCGGGVILITIYHCIPGAICGGGVILITIFHCIPGAKRITLWWWWSDPDHNYHCYPDCGGEVIPTTFISVFQFVVVE
jgi:hypothetical protein